MLDSLNSLWHDSLARRKRITVRPSGLPERAREMGILINGDGLDRVAKTRRSEVDASLTAGFDARPKVGRKNSRTQQLPGKAAEKRAHAVIERNRFHARGNHAVRYDVGGESPSEAMEAKWLKAIRMCTDAKRAERLRVTATDWSNANRINRRKLVRYLESVGVLANS